MGVTHKPKSGATLTGTQYEASDAHAVAIAASDITATGTPSASTFLRGDWAWSDGPRGATGARGATGTAGTNGTNGTNGAKGATGSTGPSGQSTTFAQFLALGTI